MEVKQRGGLWAELAFSTRCGQMRWLWLATKGTSQYGCLPGGACLPSEGRTTRCKGARNCQAFLIWKTTFERLSPPRMLGGLQGKSLHLTFWQEAFVAVSCACAWTSRSQQSPTEHISPQIEVAWCSSGPCPEVLQTVALRNYLVCFVWKARWSQLRNDYNWSLKSKDPISKI